LFGLDFVLKKNTIWIFLRTRTRIILIFFHTPIETEGEKENNLLLTLQKMLFNSKLIRLTITLLFYISFSFAQQNPVLIAEVASATTFRLGVRFNGWSTSPISNPSLSTSTWIPAPSTNINWNNGLSGIQTSFGALLTDGISRWILVDANNQTLVESNGIPFLNNGSSSIDAGIVLPVAGISAANGPPRSCLGNGFFGPTFYYNRDASYFSFASSSWEYDPTPQNHHCYPVSFSGNIGSTDMCTNIQNYTDINGDRSSKFPNGLSNQSLSQCCAACKSDPECIAYVWSDGSDPDPTGNCWPMASIQSTYNRVGRFAGTDALPQQQAWWGMGQAMDWYLAPAATPLTFTNIFYELTGAPAIPPRHALGFMATYWGYKTMEEVESYMVQFRDGAFPIDSFSTSFYTVILSFFISYSLLDFEDFSMSNYYHKITSII
jgi:hypothetical protein